MPLVRLVHRVVASARQLLPLADERMFSAQGFGGRPGEPLVADASASGSMVLTAGPGFRPRKRSAGRRLTARQILKAVQVALDLAVLALAHFLAYELRFDFHVPATYREAALWQFPVVLAIQFAALRLTGVYSFLWRYVGLVEAFAFARAIVLAALPLLLLRLAPLGDVTGGSPLQMPLSVIMMEAMLAFSGVLGLRVARRMLFEYDQQRGGQTGAADDTQAAKPVLLVGAGRAGISALQAIVRSGHASIRPVGFVDDDPAKQGLVLHGVRVLGTTAQLPRLVRKLGVDHVVITIARASRRDIRRIVEACEKIPVKVRIIPGLIDLLEGNIEAKICDVAIEDLLGRETVMLEEERVREFLAGKRVMVTGAGGSIGSELCRQIARYGPASLILVERCEYALFTIERELRSARPGLDLVPRLADVGDLQRMRGVFAADRPHVVLHAAAHKHVPLMEDNPCEAVKNNVVGTQTVARVAGEHGAESFVLVSTDKAVRPTSVMGATKRVAELLVQRFSSRYSTHYVAVRFGNVLGSTGSVVPIFRDQIARGGPVTVTHPDMIRYFMTIPEATQLVLQAGAMRADGEILVLDMGEPVRVLDLAIDMIKLSGLRPHEDIEIVYSGIRPGEKLYEELSTGDEVLAKTRHPKILSGKLSPRPLASFDRELDTLAALAARGDDDEVRHQLARLLPEAQLALPPRPAMASAS